ncbi:uncharacterized protein BCR38DRAFT_300466, partial [Pseudomassariella vexata]
IGSVIPLTVLTTIFGFARIFVKTVVVHRFQIDDGLIVTSVLATWVATAASIAAVYKGYGRLASVINEEDKMTVLRLSDAIFACGILSFALPKLAIVFMMTRLISPPKWHRIVLWSLATFCLAGLMGNVLALVSGCKIEEKSNGPNMVTNICVVSSKAVYYATSTSAISGLTNLCLATYAMLAMRKMRLNGNKRVALTVAVGLGFVGTFMAIYKCTRLKILSNPDFSYDAAELVIWTYIEGSATIIAASIPALQPLLDL